MSLLIPSYKSGFARNAAESENPNLWKGLVGLWAPSLGPTGLTLRDWSGFQNHGTLTNMDPATDWVPTEKGWALDLDGDNDTFTLPISGLLSGGKGSILVWIKANAGYGEAGIPGVAWRYPFGIFIVSASGVLYGRIWQTVGAATFAQIATVPVGEWVPIVITADGTTGRQYLSGEFIDDVLYDGTFDVSSGQIIGHQSNVNFGGLIGLTAIWNRALAPSEIQQLYADSYDMLRLRQEVFPTAVAAPTDGVARMIFLTGAV